MGAVSGLQPHQLETPGPSLSEGLLLTLNKCRPNRSICSHSHQQPGNFVDFAATPATSELRSFAGGWVGVPKKKSLIVYSVGGSRYSCLLLKETRERGDFGHLLEVKSCPQCPLCSVSFSPSLLESPPDLCCPQAPSLPAGKDVRSRVS